VLEIDGASNNGVDQVRELRQNAAVRPNRTRSKIYIIDEVHMLSPSAFNALLKTLEEPPEHVKFIFATTEPQKIPITILSRCQRFDFAGISSSAIQQRLAQIAAAEGVQVGTEALQILASRAAGSMRDSQSLLEQLLAVGRERISADDINQLLGIAPAERLSGLVRNLVAGDAPAALAELDATIQGGVEVGLLLDQLVGYFRDVMAMAVGCSADQLIYALPSQAEEVARVGKQLGLSTVLAVGQILDHTAARMRVSMHGRTLVEMALVRICQLDELDELATLIAEVRGQPHLGSVENASRQTDAKKNVEPRPAPQRELTSQFERRTDGPHAARRDNGTPVGKPDHDSEQPAPAEITDASADSVLAQWQRAMADNKESRPTAAPPRPSRREQLAQIAEQPFVKRAMELFDVPLDKLRYTTAEESGRAVVE
jgi:DNA polymerase-3 subunit gamma/tau